MGKALRGVIVAGAFIGAGILLMSKGNKLTFKQIIGNEAKDDHVIEIPLDDEIITPEEVMEEMTEETETVEEPVLEDEEFGDYEEDLDGSTDEVFDAEEEEPVEDVNEELVYQDLDARAQTIALELAKMSSVSDRGILFSKEDVKEAILALNGLNSDTGAAAKIGRVNYISSFFTSIPNSPDLIIKKTELNETSDSLVRRLDYNMDIAKLIIGEQETSCNNLLFYMDELHKNALSSPSRSFTEYYCEEFFSCLGSLVYGDGFKYLGKTYTIEDITGPNNLIPNALVQLFIYDLDPLSDDIGEVTIQLANGTTKKVRIIDICAPFRVNGQYYESWVSDVENQSIRK